MICIHESVTGAGRHLVCTSKTKGFQWTPEIPDGAWVLGPDVKQEQSLFELASVHGRALVMAPADKYMTSAEVLLGRSPEPGDIAWRHYMTGPDFKAYITALVDASFSVLEDADTAYYTNYYVPMMQFLSSLQRAKIDKDTYQSHIESNVSPALKTFSPDIADLAPPVTYTKSRTKTGRLIVTNGPDILTLPKSCRDIIVPLGPGGAIAYVDYASMEPRFVLALADREIEGDLYMKVGEIAGRSTAPRERLKLAVTSVLYGAGADSVAKTMDCSIRSAVEISNRIDDYFHAGDLRRRLEEEYKAHGFVRNFYGKRVYPDGGTPGLLLNNYIQSSATDAAILGFRNGTLEGASCIRSLFVLHDASFIDVKSVQAIRRFVAGAERIPGLSVRMPLSVQRIGGKRV